MTTAFSTRPGWHDWGVGIAYAVAQRADCTRRRVGAVVFDEANRILATGYNGAPIGGLKVTTESAWFAARPSGTEDVYKIYAESLKGPEHLSLVQAEAREVVGAVLG